MRMSLFHLPIPIKIEIKNIEYLKIKIRLYKTSAVPVGIMLSVVLADVGLLGSVMARHICTPHRYRLH